MLKVEKTGDTSKEAVKKKTFLRGRSLFWVKQDATEREEERLEKDNTRNKLLRETQRLLFSINRVLGGVVFGIGKRLRRNPERGQVTDGLQVGSDKVRGDIYEETVKEKKGESKAIPAVSSAAESSEVSKGFPLISYLERKIVSRFHLFLKLGKIKSRKQVVYSGRRAQAVTILNKGKPYGWRIPRGTPTDIHLPTTIREASRKLGIREKSSETALKICLEDVRETLRLYKAPLTLVFLIDLSGSMLLSLEPVREALLKLHADAYRSRDRVGIVALKGLGAVVVQHPRTNLRESARGNDERLGGSEGSKKKRPLNSACYGYHNRRKRECSAEKKP